MKKLLLALFCVTSISALASPPPFFIIHNHVPFFTNAKVNGTPSPVPVPPNSDVNIPMGEVQQLCKDNITPCVAKVHSADLLLGMKDAIVTIKGNPYKDDDFTASGVKAGFSVEKNGPAEFTLTALTTASK